MTFEKLDRAFVLHGSHARRKGAEVAPLAGAWIALAGIEAVFAGWQLAYHRIEPLVHSQDWRSALNPSSKSAWPLRHSAAVQRRIAAAAIDKMTQHQFELGRFAEVATPLRRHDIVADDVLDRTLAVRSMNQVIAEFGRD